MAFSNSTSPEIIWGLGGPEEDHQLHHCCWTGRVGEREEDTYVSEKIPRTFGPTCTCTIASNNKELHDSKLIVFFTITLHTYKFVIYSKYPYAGSFPDGWLCVLGVNSTYSCHKYSISSGDHNVSMTLWCYLLMSLWIICREHRCCSWNFPSSGGLFIDFCH